MYVEGMFKVVDQNTFEQVLKDSGGALVTEDTLLVQQLSRLLPEPKMCGGCGFGPLDPFKCSAMDTHDGEVKAGGVKINNHCPRCDWFHKDRAVWPAWDGKLSEEYLHDNRAVGKRAVMALQGDEHGEPGGPKTYHLVFSLDADCLPPKAADSARVWDGMHSNLYTALAAGDPVGGHPANYNWPDRGVSSGSNYDALGKDMLFVHGRYSLVRKQTLRECRVLQGRLLKHGFDSSIHGPPRGGGTVPYPEELRVLPLASLPAEDALLAAVSGASSQDRRRILDALHCERWSSSVSAAPMSAEERQRLALNAQQRTLVAILEMQGEGGISEAEIPAMFELFAGSRLRLSQSLEAEMGSLGALCVLRPNEAGENVYYLA